MRWENQRSCHTCHEQFPEAVAITNGLAPREVFCSEECSRVLNALRWYERRRISWNQAKEKAYRKCHLQLDRDLFFEVCDRVHNGDLTLGSGNGEFIAWTSADQQEIEQASTNSLEYDTFWTQAQQIMTLSGDPLASAGSWENMDCFYLPGNDPHAPGQAPPRIGRGDDNSA